MGFFSKLLIGLTAIFLGILIIVVILSCLAGSFGFDVVSALMLVGVILLIPVSGIVVIWLGLYIYKNIKTNETVNAIIVILLIIALAIGIYFLWAWAIGQIVDLWGIVVASW